MMKFAPNNEQNEAVFLSTSGHDIKVNALAGTGKTTTLKLIAEARPMVKMLYLTFTKAMADESSGQFPRNVECRTAHSVAYRAIVSRTPQYREKLKGRLNGYFVSKSLGIRDASEVLPLQYSQYGNLVLKTVNNYMQCYSPEFKKRHVPMVQIREIEEKRKIDIPPTLLRRIYEDAQRLWGMMIDPNDSMYMSHDTYLKLYALSRPTLSDYGAVLFDEAQDANGVLVSIVYGSQPQKAYIGDQFQQIYLWRGSVNTMQTIDVPNTVYLTKSYRFGKNVAAIGSAILKYFLGASVSLEGFEQIKDKVVGIGRALEDHEINTIIFRTNAGLMAEAMLQIQAKRKVCIVGDIAALIALVEGIRELKDTGRSKHSELSDFPSYEELIDYSESEMGKDLGVVIRMIDDNGFEALIRSLEGIKDNVEEESDIILTTAHKAKGREWNNCCIGGDFKALEDHARYLRGDKDGAKEVSTEELNLIYVTATRAKRILDVSRCGFFDLPPFHPLVETGKS